MLIVSETVGYGDLMAALEGARQTLGRAINPVLYSEAEFQRRLQEDNAFLTRVMQQPKIWLIGQVEHAEHKPNVPT
ncbi:MAG: hypothetical protein U5L74_04505 [Ideonella sp.]|nr:hypothetical protein [Ideonella sp.]